MIGGIWHMVYAIWCVVYGYMQCVVCSIYGIYLMYMFLW